MHLYDFSGLGPKRRYAVLTILCIGFVALVFLVWGGTIEAVTSRLVSVARSGSSTGLSDVSGTLDMLLDLGLVLLVPILLAIAAAAWFQWRIIAIAHQEREAAKLDHHTGLLTRQVFMRAVRYGISPDHDHAKSFGLLALLSIDRFTDLVAEHGIATADNVAISVAAALKRLNLENTLLCRFGESSFALAVEGRPDDATREIIESISDRIREDLARSRKMVSHITVSAGVSSVAQATSEMRLQSAIVLNATAREDGGDRVISEH